jgi:hypothetical protein
MKFGLKAVVGLLGLVTVVVAPQAWGQHRVVKMQVKSVIGQDAECQIPSDFEMSMEKAFRRPEGKRTIKARTLVRQYGPQEHLLRIMQKGRKLSVVETVSSSRSTGTCTYVFKNTKA